MKVKASQKCQASLKSRFLQVTKKGQKGRGRMKKRSLHYFKLLCWCIPADWMKKNCNWTWKTFFPCRCTTVIVPLFGGHYKSWVRPLDKEKKFISSLPSQSSVLGGLEFCAWYILLVCPNHPRINLSFLGHCLSYDENLDGLSTLYPT